MDSTPDSHAWATPKTKAIRIVDGTFVTRAEVVVIDRCTPKTVIVFDHGREEKYRITARGMELTGQREVTLHSTDAPSALEILRRTRLESAVSHLSYVATNISRTGGVNITLDQVQQLEDQLIGIRGLLGGASA